MNRRDERIPTSELATTAEGSDAETMSRREFIRGAVVASAAAAAFPATAGALSERATRRLTGEHQRMLALVLNRLIPSDGTMPAAGDLGIASFIEKALEAAPHLSRHVMGLLAALPDEADFRRMSDREADARLERLAREQPASFDILVQATYTGYYSDARVQEILGWADPVNTGYRFTRFDEACLDGRRRLERASTPTS